MTEEELEALDLMQEECAEIIQIISKIRRFGESSYHPDDPNKRTNVQLLTDEIGDMELLVNFLIQKGLIYQSDIEARMAYKLEKSKQFTNLFRNS